MANNRAELIQQLLQVAQDFDNKGKGVDGDGIRSLIGELNAGKKDYTQIKINARMTLNKFDGEKVKGDNKVPVETIEQLVEL